MTHFFFFPLIVTVDDKQNVLLGTLGFKIGLHTVVEAGGAVYLTQREEMEGAETTSGHMLGCPSDYSWLYTHAGRWM